MMVLCLVQEAVESSRRPVGWMVNSPQIVRRRARVIGKYWPRVKEWVVDQFKPGTLDSEIRRKR